MELIVRFASTDPVASVTATVCAVGLPPPCTAANAMFVGVKTIVALIDGVMCSAPHPSSRKARAWTGRRRLQQRNMVPPADPGGVGTERWKITVGRVVKIGFSTFGAQRPRAL